MLVPGIRPPGGRSTPISYASGGTGGLHRAAVATAQELFATAPDMIQGAAGTFFMELMMLHVSRRAAARRAYAVFQTRVVYRGNCHRWRKLSVFKRERGVMDMDHRQYRRWRRKSAYLTASR